jgi:hypothetical protein
LPVLNPTDFAIIYRGFNLTSFKILSTYKPTVPILVKIMPPRNQIEKTIVVTPEAKSAPRILAITKIRANKKEMEAIVNPMIKFNFNSKFE